MDLPTALQVTALHLPGQYNVSFLGFWNASGNGSNGLIEPHEIGIWDYVGALVVSGTVDDATATLLDDFWWTDISNVVLAPGNYTIGALTESGSELFALGVQNLVTDPRVVYGTGLVVAGGGGLARPTTPIGLPPDAFGPNFAEHIGIPSVPGPLPLLGIGTAFGFSRKLSRRIKGCPSGCQRHQLKPCSPARSSTAVTCPACRALSLTQLGRGDQASETVQR